MGYLRWMPLSEVEEAEARNRGPKPRPEMKSNGSCVVCMIATLVEKEGPVQEVCVVGQEHEEALWPLHV